MSEPYLSIVEIPGDGVTTQHEFNFAGGYIAREHVKAFVEDAGGARTVISVVDAMFVNDTTLNLGVAAPVGGFTRIYRDTPRDLPLVDFEGGSRFLESDLDVAVRQTLFVAAEAFDAGGYAAVNDLLNSAAVSAATAEFSATAAGVAATTASAAAGAASDSAVSAAASAAAAASALAAALLKANNLSDLTNTATARANLGLSAAATRAVAGASGALYARDGIVATVGQSGGVPTGGIIERGSNANGQYVRFADGTQVCWNTDATQRAIPTASGTLYVSAPATLTFPSAFSVTPVATLQAADAVNAPAWAGSSSTTTTGITAAYLVSASNTATAKLAYVAVGRWF